MGLDITVFQNRIKVNIYGPDLEIEDADMNFTSTFTSEKEPNSCKLRIYNLKEETLNAVLKKTEYVEIFTNQYGLKDSDGQLIWQPAFAGTKRDIEKKAKTAKGKSKYLTPSITVHDGEEADEYIEIDLQEGDGKDIGTFVSKSYKNGFNVKKILTDLAKSINMEIVFDKNIKNFFVTYPIILHDNVRNSLTKVASYIGATVTISNNRVYVVGNNPDGVISYYHFDETNIPQPKFLQDKKIEFIAPFMSNLIVGSFIKLSNKKMELDDVLQISKTENSFSNHSEECETKVTVKY